MFSFKNVNLPYIRRLNGFNTEITSWAPTVSFFRGGGIILRRSRYYWIHEAKKLVQDNYGEERFDKV